MNILDNYYDIVVLDSGILKTHKSINNKLINMYEIKLQKDGAYNICEGCTFVNEVRPRKRKNN